MLLVGVNQHEQSNDEQYRSLRFGLVRLLLFDLPEKDPGEWEAEWLIVPSFIIVKKFPSFLYYSNLMRQRPTQGWFSNFWTKGRHQDWLSVWVRKIAGEKRRHVFLWVAHRLHHSTLAVIGQLGKNVVLISFVSWNEWFNQNCFTWPPEVLFTIIFNYPGGTCTGNYRFINGVIKLGLWSFQKSTGKSYLVRPFSRATRMLSSGKWVNIPSHDHLNQTAENPWRCLAHGVCTT